MDLPSSTILRVVKPVHGIPESGLHWYLTYMEHHMTQLGMYITTVDPCIMARRLWWKIQLERRIIFPVDDSLILGNAIFQAVKETASKTFMSKQKTPLRDISHIITAHIQRSTLEKTTERRDQNGPTREDKPTIHNN